MYDNRTRVLNLKDFEMGDSLIEARSRLQERDRIIQIGEGLYLVPTQKTGEPLDYFSITGKHSKNVYITTGPVATFSLDGSITTSVHKTRFSGEFELPNFGKYIVAQSTTNRQLYIAHPKRGPLEIIQYAIEDDPIKNARTLRKTTAVLIQDSGRGVYPIVAFLRETSMLLIGKTFACQSGIFRPLSNLELTLQSEISE